MIARAVRLCLRFALSLRGVDQVLAERGVEVSNEGSVALPRTKRLASVRSISTLPHGCHAAVSPATSRHVTVRARMVARYAVAVSR